MQHPEPSTSQSSSRPHPRQDLHRFVNELNVRYRLGIPVSGLRINPAKRKDADSAAARLHRRLEFHFYGGGVEDLNALLREFDRHAKKFWSKCMKKSHKRDSLQKLLNDVLDRAQPAMPAPRTFGRSHSGPAGFGEPSAGASTGASSDRQSSTQPKRRADVDLRDARKRPKGDPIKDLTNSTAFHSRVAGASAPRTGVVAPETLSRTTNQSFKSVVSLSTSGTSFQSAVFSAHGDPPVATQDTVEANSQGLRHPGTTPSRPFSQDSYINAPSSATQEALHVSFTEFEAHLPQPSLFAHHPSRGGARSDVLAVKDSKLCDFLRCIWPCFPDWLRDAPFPVAWELTRIAQDCDVDLRTVDMKYESSWTDQKQLRISLWKQAEFQGKAFPESSSAAAWEASLEQSTLLPFDQQVVYSASLDFNNKTGSLRLTIHPLKLEQSHRLGRYFGADRFLELLLPSPDSSNLPGFAKKRSSESFFEDLVGWLADEQYFCGRQWKAFYTKSGGSRKPVRDLQFGPEPRPVYKDRVYFFAESAECDSFIKTPMYLMLNWALQFDRKPNRDQPVLKLFQRIALVLSKTSPSVVFKPSQIRNRKHDLLSPQGKVMNDGVARISPAVATRIKVILGLTATPSAVQGRLGSAKGMWVVDVTEISDKLWIETFPSQRKWDLDWENADEEHRTLEIRNFASMPKSASFNLQFLPVLEDRAINKTAMRQTVGHVLRDNLQEELDGQKRALQSALQYRQWTHENSSRRQDRLIHGHIPYQGGRPQEDEELINNMLDAGFDPKSNAFLKRIVYDMQLRKCQALKKKLNIKVGRSAYLYMVMDFWGVLEENEVHVSFSTAFEADDAWSKTMVQGVDVLVARSPAHFISDIQRVKAVFKPELADLTDVVVFSGKGNIPLADKLSGGDYDGDLAWVCWDSHIVENFQNAEVQTQPDLSQYMPKDKETFTSLLSKHPKPRGKRSLEKAVSDMMAISFAFNLSKSMLGVCTNYKERLCYKNNTVRDDAARLLSTLLSNLVDQAKQGVRFTAEDFNRLRQDSKLPLRVDEPHYKKESWLLQGPKVHIIDYLKFEIAQPTIAKELKEFNTALEAGGTPSNWDEDLTVFYNDYEGQVGTQSHSKSMDRLLTSLRNDIKTLATQWDILRHKKTISYSDMISKVYAMWQNIQPREETSFKGRTNSKTVSRLKLGGELSHWALLKASTAFWMFCKPKNREKYGANPGFVWQMACRQLCYLKAMAVAKRGPTGTVGAPTVVLPHLYAALRPDAKFIKQREAKKEGQGSLFSQGWDDVESDVD